MANRLKDFFPDKLAVAREEERSISPRLPAFRLKAVTEETGARIRAAATQTAVVKGLPVKEIDPEKNMLGLVVACVIQPDLQDAELQTAWGVMGAESLVQKMLLPGAYAELSAAVEDICGLDRDIDAMVEQAKNSSAARRLPETPPQRCRRGAMAPGLSPR